jgi:uncharacterized phage protein (TIGR01671 family)
MARTIKFRAWDGEEMHTSFEGIWFGPYEAKTKTDNAILLMSMKDRVSIPIWGVGLVLMQFTGLYDINEREIYEGDILKVHKFIEVFGENAGASEGELEFIAEVQYLDVGVFLKTTKIAYDDITYSGFVACMEGLHEDSFEVIGNKYEHDYLLEAKNF